MCTGYSEYAYLGSPRKRLENCFGYSQSVCTKNENKIKKETLKSLKTLTVALCVSISCIFRSD